MATLTGDLAAYQSIYNDIDNSAFSGWSDGSKSGFWNYVAADKANQHEIEMWKMQNEYNTPANQMSRYVAAGLNPNAVYSQVTSGNSQSAPGTHVPTFNFTDNKERFTKIQTALQAVSTLLNGVSSVIGSAQGVQNMRMNSDDTYISAMRLKALQGGYGNPMEVSDLKTMLDAGYKRSDLVHLYGDVYTTPRTIALFPELRMAGQLSQSAELVPSRLMSLDSASSLRNKQLEIDKLLDSTIESTFSGNPNWDDILKLILIQLSRRY